MAVTDTTPLTRTLLTQDFAATAARTQQSTVHVRSGRAGSGSGVIWRPDGLIITNAHVARGSRATVELWDGREFDAEVTASDPQRDLASLRIEASDLPAVTAGDSDALRVGQLVVAVGNPLGISGALTTGIIHAIAPAPSHGRQTWVQADVELLPGNSGGPLADVLGHVIGINSMVAGGLGLAVPSNAVAHFLGNQAGRPRLGITTQPVLVASNGQRVPGLVVLEAEPGGAAEAGGLIVGDVLIGANGKAFAGPGDLGAILAQSGPGGVIQLDILHGGRQQQRQVVTGIPNDARKEAA